MTYSEKLKHPSWQKKRLEILNRDDWTCQLCKDTENELHIHHLKYNDFNNPADIDNVNLITYCKYCHEIVEDIKKCNGIVYRVDVSRNAALTYKAYSIMDGKKWVSFLDFTDGEMKIMWMMNEVHLHETLAIFDTL